MVGVEIFGSPLGVSKESMSHAARVLALLSRSVVAVSTKLSIGAVLGLAALPMLPHDAASKLGGPAPQPAAAPIQLVHAKPVPLVESAPADPAFELVARRQKRTREPPPEAKETAHKTSTITPEPTEAAAQPPPETKPDNVLQDAGKTRPKQVRVPQASEPAQADRSARGSKTSSIAPPAPAIAPIPSPDAKPAEAAPAEAPKPQVWSEADVIAALRECVRLLAPIAADVEVSEPVKREQCGAPAPVLVRRIGSGAGKIEINPPAVLNCAMVVSLHAWVEKSLQPAAREGLGSPIARLRNASGYVCRARNGHPLGTDKLSEHALANAIDIAGFITADGRTIDVARSWGPTARDQREAEKVAAAKKEPPKASDAKPEPAQIKPSNKKISAIAYKVGEAPQGQPQGKAQDARSLRRTAALQRSGKATSDVSADPKAIPLPGQPQREDAKKSAEAGFLRRLHKGACGVFGTVLGPEANELHRDHFHFDLAQRRHNAFCQ